MVKNISNIDDEDLKLLLQKAEYALVILDAGAELEIMYANDMFYQMLQYTAEEYQEKYGNSLMATVSNEEKQKLRNLIARQAAAGGKLRLEYRAIKKDGSVAWIFFAANMHIKDGKRCYYSTCIDVTKSKLALDDAYNAKREIDVIANSIPGALIKVRMSDYSIKYANDGFYLLTGYSRVEYRQEFGDYCDAIICQGDAENVKDCIDMAIENHGMLGFECRCISKSNDLKWVYVSGRRIDDDEGQPVFLCVVTDITSKKQLEVDFYDNIKRAELITHFLEEVLWTYNIEEQRLTRTGYTAPGSINSDVVEQIFGNENMEADFHPDDIEMFKEDFEERKNNVGSSQRIFRMKNNKGNYQTFELIAISISEDGSDKPTKIHGIIRAVKKENIVDVSDNSNVESRLFAMAKSAQAKAEDSVTGLMPYASFLSEAERTLRCRKDDDHYAVLCADINEFLKIEHQYGFSISNDILKIFTKVIKENIADDGICSRVDGDYFVVLFKYEHHRDLMNIMSSIVSSKEEYDQKEGNIKFGTTTGIYLVQPEDKELSDMLERADLARRSIKGLMGNHYAIYTDDLQKERFCEEEIINEIYSAIRNKTIEIYYMPRFKGNKENIIGCKAVPRVILNDGQYIESVKLLKFIERGGKLKEFAFESLASVCCSMGAWKKKGNKVVPLSIEITASELSLSNAADIIDDIVVNKNGLEPSDIIFEIHERYFAHETTMFDMTIKALAGKGYKVIISRFGSDHTAIHTIRRLPITGIKFHGEFFGVNMADDKEKIMLKNLVSMAKELGMTVACGGIHTKLQEEYALSIGCDVLEGDMYYGKVKSAILEKCFLA